MKIIGTIINSEGQRATAVSIRFSFKSNPAISSGHGVYAPDRVVSTDDVGEFEAPGIPAGRWSMAVGGIAIYHLVVPDNNNEADFTTLLDPDQGVSQTPEHPLATLGLALVQHELALAAWPSGTHNKMGMLYAPADADHQFFRYDRDSLAVHDGSTVIKPTDLEADEPGRWLWVNHNGAGALAASVISVSTRAALKALASNVLVKAVIVTNREDDDVGIIYTSFFGDVTAGNDGSVIQPTDGLTRYHRIF